VYEDANHYPNNARITQTTVQAMLARVYLHMAGEPLKDASAWMSARDWARKVVASGQHRLDPKYEDVFIRMIQETPDLDYRESMWEVEFHGVDGESPRTNGIFGGQNGIYCRNPDIGFAYQALCITRTMLACYNEDPNDKRRDWNIATYTYGASATNTTKIPITNVEGYFIGKYRKDVYTGPKGNNFTSTNYPAMRYADVLLMLAEAANEADGPTDEAINALNQVRERAGVALCANKVETGKISLTNRDEFRAFIKKERARELCYELRTRADLLRWGDLVSEIKATASTMATSLAKLGGNNITDKHVLFPIPATELNTNKLAVQNPGW
ncbi:MAG: RagB/SusD family nutrient uptake outer membrane protein, partial [Tannerella sp.]|jgi:hypothetical protein|nr:RagB/SusD family nutrient uptake outer membrane protein [Tannerella sp.]